MQPLRFTGVPQEVQVVVTVNVITTVAAAVVVVMKFLLLLWSLLLLFLSTSKIKSVPFFTFACCQPEDIS